ncbi:unnamed protein product [Clavelina lepadiformis]|uniref:Uncharacterized protein n=1 Tax=Clavelina lepadiformis TaxID=159417 RepID=A0ABP0F1V7_CLALP
MTQMTSEKEATVILAESERPLERFWTKVKSDNRTANKIFWKTIRKLRNKRSSTANSVKNQQGGLTKKYDILGGWREYFKDPLNSVAETPTDTQTIFFRRRKYSH